MMVFLSCWFGGLKQTAPAHPLADCRDCLALRDRRISSDGVLVLKAQRFRSQEKNRADALERLQDLIAGITVNPKKRQPTRPSKSAKRKRMDSKTRRGKLKSLRGRIEDD